jgi:hypothetical protein
MTQPANPRPKTQAKTQVRIKRSPNPSPGQRRGQVRPIEDDRAGLDRVLAKTLAKPKGR